MEYKGFNVSEITPLLLVDILQELKELRIEINWLKENPALNIPVVNEQEVGNLQKASKQTAEKPTNVAKKPFSKKRTSKKKQVKKSVKGVDTNA